MEILAVIAELIPTLGFPIVVCLAAGWFIYKIYKDTTKNNQDNMTNLQARCQEREEKLYVQLEKQNEINGRFAEIIAQYEVKLDEIKEDVKDIKQEVLIIKAH
jgi:hypothetical protein